LFDPKKRIGRGIDIGRLRDSRPETNLATLKKEVATHPPMLRRMGLVAGKSLTNRAGGSLLSYSVQTTEVASTDTQSFVSVAVSEARPRFATHFATDQRLGSAESASNWHPVGQGGGGLLIGRGCRFGTGKGVRNFISKCARSFSVCCVECG